MSSLRSTISRRKFLLLAATAAAVAGAAASTQQKASSTGRSVIRQVEGAGYQATAHVRNYYRTARI
jgi:hypothetical protein